MTVNEKDMQANGQANAGAEGAQNTPGTNEQTSETSNLNADVNESGELDKKQQELGEMRDKYLRLVAEFDNYKKRTAKERIDLMQTANREVIAALLDVLDDSERASKQLESSTDISAIKDGVMLVFNKLKSTLLSKGLKAMESVHKEFDVDLHDAITEIPAPTDDLKGKVLDEVQKGYYLNDKIIRHAKVVVGK